MSSRPGPPGRPTWSLRSKRPGRSSAGSSVAAWLVAPITITLYWGIFALGRCRIRRRWRNAPFGAIMPSIWMSSSLTYMLPMPIPGAMMNFSGPRAWRLVSAASMVLETAPRLALEEDAVGRVAARVAESLEPLEEGEGLLGRLHDLGLAADVVEGDVVFPGVDDVGLAAGQQPEDADDLDHPDQQVERQHHDEGEQRHRHRQRRLQHVELGRQRVVGLDQVGAVLRGDAWVTAEDVPPVETPGRAVHPVEHRDHQRPDDQEDDQPFQGLPERVSECVTHGTPAFLPPNDHLNLRTSMRHYPVHRYTRAGQPGDPWPSPKGLPTLPPYKPRCSSRNRRAVALVPAQGGSPARARPRAHRPHRLGGSRAEPPRSEQPPR